MCRAVSLGVVLVERLTGSSEAGFSYPVAMAVLVLSSFSSSLVSSSIHLVVSGGGSLAVEGARVAAGLTSLAIALAAPPCSSRCSVKASRSARWLSPGLLPACLLALRLVGRAAACASIVSVFGLLTAHPF
jgi:hypothetical protein